MLPTTELIWNRIALPKHRFILWLVVRGRLLTKERLVRMGISCDNNTCVLCDGNWQKDVTHIFSKCYWLKRVCDAIQTWIELRVQNRCVDGALLQIKVNCNRWKPCTELLFTISGWPGTRRIFKDKMWISIMLCSKFKM